MQKIILLTVKLIFLGALLVGLLTPVQTTNAGISPSARLSSTARHIPAAQMSPSATAVWLDGTTLYYRADSGQQNQVTTSLSGADLQVYDAGAALTPGAGCTAVDANTVSCPAAGVTLLYLDLGDQSDSAILTTHLNSVITGGDGLFYSDVLTVTGTTANDTFIISGTQVTRSGGETVTFNGIESLGVDGLGGEYVDMDSYTVNFGSLPLLVNIGDSGSSLISLDSLTLYGTPAADTFLAASGQIGLVTFPPQIVSQHDVEVIQVYGGAGDDTFDCGLASWPLLLYGQAGNDELTGSLLGGSLDGGEGDDILHASAGPELLTGGTGDDDYIFSDGWGLDSISESNDAGVDTLDFTAVTTDTTVTISPLSVADAGSDRLAAGDNVEYLLFGSGDDTFIFGNGDRLAGGNGTIDGGGGINTLDYAAYTSSVNVDLAAGSATGTAGITHIRDVAVGLGADRLRGDAAENQLNGNAGNDSLVGGAGSDTLTGGAGNDTLAGEPGNDTLTGGTGDDRYIFTDGWGNDTFAESSSEGTDSLDFSSVTDSLIFSATQSITITAGEEQVTGSNVEILLGGSGNDTFNVDASGLTLDGQSGADAYTTGFNWNGVLTVADSGAAGLDSLIGYGTPNDDAFTISNTLATCGAEAVIYGETIETVEFQGREGDDLFNVTASPYFTLTVDGGRQPSADVLNFDAQGQPFTWDGSLPDGVISVPGLRPVYYLNIEQVNFLNRLWYQLWLALVVRTP